MSTSLIENKKLKTEIRWDSREWIYRYTGDYLNQLLHGEGTFTWNHNLVEKVVYEGNLYANDLQGYGRVSYPSGALFEGLFKHNLKHGPGIYTHANGSQDVGLWDSQDLIRLSRSVADISRLGLRPTGKIKLLGYRKLIPIEQDMNPNIKEMFNPKIREPTSKFFNKQLFDVEFYQDNIKEIPISDIIAWNNTPIFLDILKHTFMNRNLEGIFAPQINKLLIGDRGSFRCPGHLEESSVHFLECCGNGLEKPLQNLVCKNKVYRNICDSRGNTGFLYAANHDYLEVIRELSKMNADINQMNDEGLTGLSIAMLRYIARKKSISDWETAFLPACTETPIKQWNSHQSFEFQSDTCIPKDSNRTVEEKKSKVFDQNFDPRQKSIFDFAPTLLDCSKRKRGGKVENLTNVENLESELGTIETTIKLLLEKRADPNVCNVPVPILILSIYSRNISIMESLLLSKADPNCRTDPCFGSLTPIHVILSSKPSQDLLPILELLLKFGANPNLRTNSTHWIELREFITSSDLNPGDSGLTPLHIISIRQDWRTDTENILSELAAILIKHRANPNLLYSGHTPLSLAMINGNLKLIKKLFSDPNQQLGPEFGVPLTLFFHLKFLEILTLEEIKAVLRLITELGASPFDKVYDDINVLEYVRENEYPDSERSIKLQSLTCKSDPVKVPKRKCISPNIWHSKRSLEILAQKQQHRRRSKRFQDLLEYLRELSDYVLEQYISGRVVRRIYKAMGDISNRNGKLESLSKVVKIPNFEKTVDVFVKMGESGVVLKRDLIELTLEYSLASDNCFFTPMINPIRKVGTTTTAVSFVDFSKKPMNEFQEIIPNVKELASLIAKLSHVGGNAFTYPEYDPDKLKYKVCFQCHSRKNVTLVTCPNCCLVQFCSRECNLRNLKKQSIHKCKNVFYDEGPKDRELDPVVLKPKKKVPNIEDECAAIFKKGLLGEEFDKYLGYMMQVAGDVDFEKLFFPYCAYRDGNIYYRLFGENCVFVENYSLV